MGPTCEKGHSARAGNGDSEKSGRVQVHPDKTQNSYTQYGCLRRAPVNYAAQSSTSNNTAT